MPKKQKNGLTAEEVEISRAKYGSNRLEGGKKQGFFSLFRKNLSDPIIKVLIFSVLCEVAVTFGRCNWIETSGIIFAVLLAATLSTASEYKSARAFEKLKEESRHRVRILRGGEYCELSADEIVVGDRILLSAGETVPADGHLVGGELFVDQSGLNGESREEHKIPGETPAGGSDLSSPFCVFRGSAVLQGGGEMEADRVGAGTLFGMIAKDVSAETRESPMKIRLSKLAGQISRIGYVVAAFVALLSLYNAIVVENGFRADGIAAYFHDLPTVIADFAHALSLAVTMLLVSVPEGLPLMVSVVLSSNVRRMLRDRILVKKPVGIETAGSMNILFTDKTGTLTVGKTVCDAFLYGESSYPNRKALFSDFPAMRELLTIAVSATVPSDGGNSTDRALADFFSGEKAAAKVSVSSYTPFSSERKYSSARLSDGREFYKGAPEVILPLCKARISKSNEKIAAEIKEMQETLHLYTERGERLLAFSYRKSAGEDAVFLGFAVLKDRLRPGVREEILRMNEAGVQVVMLTGDSRETAATIAKECGILKRSDDVVLSRDVFSRMSDAEVRAVLPRLRVLSRALPQDKTRLVRLSQEQGLVVGMTGDGVNDSPSLKLADVGFAMGSGTEIAKEAGDVVILDNSFSAIAKTVLYGRTVFKSIRKFITFQLMMNLAACGVSLFGQIVGIESPITIMQMLWVNMIMDTLGGLAFAGEAPIGYYMKEAPKKREESILNPPMLRRILWTGGYTFLLCLLFLKAPSVRAIYRDELSFMTGFYAFFIFAGIFNAFSARSDRLSIFYRIGKNRAFLWIMAFITVIQIFMIYFGGTLFRCTPLTAYELLAAILLAFTVIPFDFFRRIAEKLSGKK